MSNKILITYASRTGSTIGVAEAIGRTLTERGLSVDVRPMQEVTDLTPYRAVVAGEAIQGQKWLPEAMEFVERHQVELLQKSFAAFLVCLTLAMKDEQARVHADVRKWLAPVRTLVPTISEGAFAGVLDLSKIPSFFDQLGYRLSILLGVWTEGDHQDWNTIRAWATELSEKLEMQMA